MNTDKVLTFADEMNELALKAALIREFEIEYADGTTATGPCWFWFVSILDQDSWFSFAVSNDADDPDDIISQSDLDELRRMSVWLGRTWEDIIGGCVHCAAVEMRAARNAMSVQIFEDVMEIESIDKLRELRTEGQWKAMQEQVLATSGQKISLN